MQLFTSFLAFSAVVAAGTALPAVASDLPRSGRSSRPNHVANHKRGSQTNSFCQNFTAECYHQALHGKTGKIKVVHACAQSGSSYTFGCDAGQQSLTSQVLAKLEVASIIYATSTSTTTVSTTSTALTTTTITAGTSTTTASPYTAQETTTSTAALLGNQPIPVVQYVIMAEQALKQRTVDKKTRRSVKPVGHIDNSNFCAAYTAACTRSCGRRFSTPKAEVCHLTSTIAGHKHSYDLACSCRNGYVETQHALADLGNSVSIATVSTVSTSYTTITASSTQTHTATSTSNLTTSAAVSTSTATSTTNIVLAPTGSIKAVSRDDGTDLGYINFDPTNLSRFGQMGPVATSSWMAVCDATSGLYAMQLTDGSGYFVSGEAGFYGSAWNDNIQGYAWTHLQAPAAPAGPASGVGRLASHPFESYLFSPVVNTTAAPPLNSNAQLSPAWVNVDGSMSAKPLWVFNSNWGGLYLVNDFNSFTGSGPVGAQALTLYLVS